MSFFPKNSTSNNFSYLKSFEANIFNLFASCIVFDEVSTDYFSIDEIKSILAENVTLMDSIFSKSDKVIYDAMNNNKFSSSSSFF